MTVPGETAELDGDPVDTRIVSLNHAVDLHRATYRPGDEGPRGDPGVLRSAELYDRWLTRPDPVAAAIVYDQPATRTEENIVQIPIDNPGPLTGRVVLKDRLGNIIPDDATTELDNVRFSVDRTDVLGLTSNPDGRSFSLDLLSVGDAIFTAEVTTRTGVRTVLDTVQVIPGDVATMEIQFDVPAPEQPV